MALSATPNGTWCHHMGRSVHAVSCTVALSATLHYHRRGTGESMSDAKYPDSRIIVVSTDGHVGPSVAHDLRPYCEAKHLDEFDRFTREMKAAGTLSWRSTETADGGGDGDGENWTMGIRARRLASDEADQFGKVAGFRNAD